ncbi:MAG: amidohydrolase family protein [Gammaproteobacteria bacterium]|nr:amidohydrolase family protein [Gammaproteobacteria bacterium]
MIIDCHAHVSAPAELWAYKALITSHRGAHGRGGVSVTDDEIRESVEKEKFHKSDHSHMDYIDLVKTDMQLLSPRPFQLMHSEKPSKLVQWFVEENNNMIYRQTQMYDRFMGVAGLPQAAGEPLDMAIAELERAVNELGFKGCLLNPDPYENSGVEPPALGDRYWYPLYEKLCELDVPAHIHGTGSKSEREPYSLRFINEETTAVYGLLHSDVFIDFPDLKIIVSHGGGAIPFQLGRFTAPSMYGPRSEWFSERIKKLYFDTVLYTPEAVEFLLKVIGPEQSLFGAECPGVGSTEHPDFGHNMDDVARYVKDIDWLTEQEKEDVLYKNTVKLFKLDPAKLTAKFS